MTELLARLGLGPDERVVIVAADDLGMCHACNEGVYRSLREGLATGSALVVPAPWSRAAAARYRGEDVGVDVTLIAEYDLYRWGPLTHAPSLLDGDGGFPRTVAELWEHADPDEARREGRAQLERAIVWGFDVSHLGSRLDALCLRPELFDVLVELATDFGLPLRLPDTAAEATAGFPVRRLAAEHGVLVADHVAVVEGGRGLERAIRHLRPGVTEVRLRPAVETPELRSFEPGWATRAQDLLALTQDRDLAVLLERAGAHLVGYRTLRALQQAG